MRKTSTYKAAHDVAIVMEQHFLKIQEGSEKKGGFELNIPTANIIETIIDTAFWASLRKEEGNSPKISVVFLNPERAENPLLFAEKQSLTSNLLTKLASGFERPGIHLGIWYNDNKELYIWGSVHKIPSFCFVLDIPEPGLLIIKHRQAEEFGKFVNVAVLNGDEIKVIDENSSLLPEGPTMLTSLLGSRLITLQSHATNVLMQLAVSIRSHKRGGTLIIVPTNSTNWKNSIRNPIKYKMHPTFSVLGDLVVKHKIGKQPIWPVALQREIDALAGLTAIDGATIINDQYELLAFGAKITRLEGGKLVEHMLVTEPVIGGEGFVTQPVQSGGTRHLSAAQFVHDQKDAIVLVASQDGRFTVFAWSNVENIVQAHRIEVLLL